MDKQKDILNELKEQAPFLSSLKKDNPFTVPENYFSNLPGKVLSKIPAEKQQPGWLEWLESLFIPRLAATGAFAAIVIAVGLYFYNIQPAEQTSTVQEFASLSDEDVDAYVTNNIDDYELSAFNGQGNFSGNIFTTVSISNDELDNFIMNNIDEQTLMEEFL